MIWNGVLKPMHKSCNESWIYKVRRGRIAILISEGTEQLINDIRVNQFGFDISEEEDERKNFKYSYLPEVYRVLPPDQLI